MPDLNQLANGSSDPTLVSLVASDPVVEPLDGPTSIDTVFDRFPEEVYQQGKDSHLYRLLSALGGDSGAGFIKAQVYAARLQFEAEYLTTSALDSFYGYQFSFPRLKGETYSGIDPDGQALTSDDWNTVQLADQSYRQRIAEFWTATRGGTTPDGLKTAAQSAIGVECEIVENYQWLFDQYSDDPLGLDPLGTTISPNEFIVIPRFKNSEDAANYEYTQNYPYSFIFSEGVPPSVTISVSTVAETALLPELERNAVNILDQLRPVASFATITVDETRYINIPAEAHASSERIQVIRLVTGSNSVNWPPIDPWIDNFIQVGVEKEAPSYNNSGRDLPIIFLTIEDIISYTEKALSDPTYLTGNFFSIKEKYKSEHTGFFSPIIQGLYPFLNGISGKVDYSINNAIAVNNTPLLLETKLT